MNENQTECQWRIAGQDEGDTKPDYSGWIKDETAMRSIFATWMDEMTPPYDEVWIETRTVAYSQPERIDG